jgi:hypothetical protein
MTNESHPPRDEDSGDPDMPIKRDTAADHRPDLGADGSHRAAAKSEDHDAHHQNPDAKLPNPAQLQKQQRSPNMNTEKNK